MCVPWLIHIWAVTRLYVRHDSFIPVLWLFDMRYVTHAYVCVVFHTCAITRLCVRHDSFMCVLWLIDMRHVTHAYVCRVSYVCSSSLMRAISHKLLIHTFSVTYCDSLIRMPCFIRTNHSYAHHDLFIRVLCNVLICVTWLTHICAVSHTTLQTW